MHAACTCRLSWVVPAVCANSMAESHNQRSVSVIEEAATLLGPEESFKFEEWRQKRSVMRIMVTGKTGAGKSTLLNGLLGVSEVDGGFKIGHRLSRGTVSVTTRSYQKNGITIVVHDTPGLQDRSGEEERYLQEIKEKSEDGIDLMLYCISMKEQRSDLHDCENTAIDKLTSVLGQKISVNTIFVLTFGNSYERNLVDADKNVEREFETRIQLWKQKIQEALRRNGVEESVVADISVQPAGFYKKRSLPGREYWLSELWAHVLAAISKDSQWVFVQAASDRFQDPSETSEEQFHVPLQHQPIVLTRTVKRILKAGRSLVMNLAPSFFPVVTAGLRAGAAFAVALGKWLSAKYRSSKN